MVDPGAMVVYGGAASGGEIVSDDLFMFDLRDDNNRQCLIVPVTGQTPGSRYGHTMVYRVPFLLVFGGVCGEPLNDVWCLNVKKAPFSWNKVATEGESPVSRVYHSAAICNIGAAHDMMVIFGGRTNDKKVLNDTWGLRKHNDGRWSWI